MSMLLPTQLIGTLVLKTSIHTLDTPSTTYHLTLCQKKGEQMGFKHSRILVYNEKQGILYYVNEPDKIPANLEPIVSKPKNQKIHISVCDIKKDKGSKQLIVNFNKKSDKDKIEGGQWVFVMETEDVADRWVAFVKEKKVQRASPKNQPPPVVNGQGTGDPNLLNIPSSNNNPNNNAQFILDEYPPQNPNTSQLNSSSLTGSKISPTNPLNKSGINIKQPNPLNKTQDPNLNRNPKYQNPNKNDDSGILAYSQASKKPVGGQEKLINNSGISFSHSMGGSGINNMSQSKTNPIGKERQTQQVYGGGTSNRNVNVNNSGIRNVTKEPMTDPVNRFSHNNTEVKRQSTVYNNINNSKSNINASSSSAYRPPINPSPYPKTNINQPIKKPEVNSNDDNTSDWNLKFLQNRTQKTVSQFSQHALSTFASLSPDTLTLRNDPSSNDSDLQPQTLTKNGVILTMALHDTKAAFNLLREFKNYHHVLESCQENRIIHVPMCCVIEYLGIVCLAKAKFPAGVEIVDGRGGDAAIAGLLRMLELYTKISSDGIKKSATLLNLTPFYGKEGNNSRIYIDNLIDYLPLDPEYPTHLLRSQLLLSHLTKPLNLKHSDAIPQLTSAITNSLHTLAESLSEQEYIIVQYSDIKNALHQHGLTAVYLPHLYTSVRSRPIKKYLYTLMLTNIVLESAHTSILQLRENSQISTLCDVLQQVFRVYCEGDNGTNGYKQVWANTAAEFKRAYRMVLNMRDIEPGFFLGSLMGMLNGEYDIGKLDKGKKLLQDRDIIHNGFLVKLKPKVRSYDKFITEKTQKVLSLCTSPSQNLHQVNALVPLSVPSQFPSSPTHLHALLAHLSTHLSPWSPQYPECKTLLYQQLLNQEPPTLTSHTISLNYAEHCRKDGKVQEYKRAIEDLVDLLGYWLGDEHILLCDIFQSLADYYEMKGQPEDCINYMKQALTTCIRLAGTHTPRTGLQYFRLAERQIKCHDTRQGLENYNKAKNTLQASANKLQQYPMTLFRIASLELVSSSYDKCIILCIKAIKQSQQTSLSETWSIKIYQLLSRAYELNHNKEQLENLAHLTAKYFNSTLNSLVFQQMIRICLIGFVLCMKPHRQEKLIEYMNILAAGGNTGDGRRGAVERLMGLARDGFVMEKFVKGVEGLEKYIAEARGRRMESVQAQEFRAIFHNILWVVGMDFMQGILSQSKYF